MNGKRIIEKYYDVVDNQLLRFVLELLRGGQIALSLHAPVFQVSDHIFELFFFLADMLFSLFNDFIGQAETS